MRILRAASHRRMAWRNGGGETREILAHPPGSDTASFAWRVSIAGVTADGPFSVFEGVDRILAVLRGEGMELAVDGLGTRVLTPRSSPFAFPADAPAAARLLGGPIADLNVMTRRGRFRVEMQRLAGETLLPPCGETTMILALGPLAIEADGTHHDLHRDDVLLATPPDAGRVVRTAGAAGGYRIAIAATASRG